MNDVHSSIGTWTASDKYTIAYRRYLPEEEPRAIVVCLHGIQSHSGWYEYSSTRMAEAGYAVYYLDRRGSGLNRESPGDAPSFRRLLDDVAEFIAHRRRDDPGLPVILAACSWGGKLAAALCRRHPHSIDGLALLCPGFRAKVKPKRKQRLGILISSRISPRRLYPIPLSDPALFTASPQWQSFIAEDPLSLRQATARLLIASARLDKFLRGVPKHVQAPLLLQLAELDRIIDNVRTRTFVESFASPDKQIIEYAGAHHTLEFEPDRDRFIDDLIGWLDATTKKGASSHDLDPALSSMARHNS